MGSDNIILTCSQVRQHHHKPGPDLSQWDHGGQYQSQAQGTLLSASPGTLQVREVFSLAQTMDLKGLQKIEIEVAV